MSFSPRGVGDASAIHGTFHTDSGLFDLSALTNSSISMHFLNASNSALHIGTGTWDITDPTNGKADYFPSAADVATAGAFLVYPVLALSTGPKPFDPQVIEFRSLP